MIKTKANFKNIRPHRYRVWDSKTNLMTQSGIKYDKVNQELICQDYQILLEYTGRFDKEGTEICENDIVSLENWDVEGDKVNRLVRFKEASFILEEISGVAKTRSYCNLNVACPTLTKIVGNKQENSELLFNRGIDD